MRAIRALLSLPPPERATAQEPSSASARAAQVIHVSAASLIPFQLLYPHKIQNSSAFVYNGAVGNPCVPTRLTSKGEHRKRSPELKTPLEEAGFQPRLAAKGASRGACKAPGTRAPASATAGRHGGSGGTGQISPGQIFMRVTRSAGERILNK